MRLPSYPNVEKLSKSLNRKLTKKEKIIIEDADDEIQMNKSIKELITNLKNKEIYIPRLSVDDGNCLYDSICYHITDINIIELRKLLSNFLKIYKDSKNIFINQELTFKEMFIIQNEIEYLHDKENDVIYKYTYDIMCADLACNNSWKRLPTEIILYCISYIFDINIKICHNNGYTHDICSIEKPLKTIYLGLINESHYIPLDIDNNKHKILLYNECIDKYNIWRQKQIDKL